ncbi:MAG: DEAD/DEAH box helicase family protein [Blastocatellia bacterium]
MFAEVAVPLYVHQTFTYALPDSFAANTKLGCRVLVPFGKQLLTGYVVGLHLSLEEAGMDTDTEIKAVEELFDTEPLVTQELLELTKWIADYYFAPWGETIKGCLPAGINAEAETLLSLTNTGRDALANTAARQTTKLQALALLAANVDDDGYVNTRLLVKEYDKTKASALVRELEKSGYVIVKRQMQDAAVKPKKQQAVRLTAAAIQAIAELHHRETANTEAAQSFPVSVPPLHSLRLGSEQESPAPKSLNDQQTRVIQTLLEAADPLGLTELTEAADVSTSVIKTLEKRGFVEIFVREVRRDPLAHVRNLKADDLALMPQQQTALDAITNAIAANKYAAFLLHGVTGSGKTEVYIRAMREALEQGKTALMLVPEISLTPMFARRLSAHFGDAVAILHSSLSDGERLDEWNRMRSGEARICIGARSGIFAPLENIGLIIVDEEHEGAYKQDSEPRYHGRDTAIVRAAVPMPSSSSAAPPSMESFHKRAHGQIHVPENGRAPYASPARPCRSRRHARSLARHGKQ